MTYISNLALWAPLRQSTQNIQNQLSIVTGETSSGLYADLANHLGARTGSLISLRNQIDQLTSYQNSNTVASTRLSTTSTALSSLIQQAQTLSSAVTSSTGVGGNSTLATQGSGALQNLISTLNTNSGDAYIFGGVNSQTQPIANYSQGSPAQQAIVNSFQTYLTTNGLTASTLTAAQMNTYLQGPFATLFSGSNWTSNWSSASSQTIQSNLNGTETLTTSVSANSSAFQQLAQGYSMLTEFAGLNLSADAQNSLKTNANSLINSAVSGLTNLNASVGAAQTEVDTVNTNLTSLSDIITQNVANLDEVDPTTLSTQLSALQTQLQVSYQLTNTLKNLTLANYLTA